ncbi:MAG: class I SAM-dependent methyltransferase [Algibacter sp.]|uniref:methyltransferase domain-containing protein n=1 Tax=Algibacter sp. TaxID=1872428 RepID=UPI002637CC10|nr:class I SAM-dependent methyltransferase [Algibacter sp.]MDG1730037.1 class I SAM-dependent methyltransferase [Algibacter sp.]MDG2178340.1 class I SAM-dependent methyltransferase [Algibacter sp.]
MKWYNAKDNMYNSIKKSLKSIIPKQFLIKNELFFRIFYGVFYLGKKHQCNICKKKLRAFVELENEDLLCPFCGSLSRNRRLWKLVNKDHALKGNVLHFSPSRNLYRRLKKTQKINYFSSDFENEFLADYKFDITKIPQENETFDTIICYHILEHITDDKKAMTELYRVLKPNGSIYIQTPFKTGDIYEDDSIVLPEERLKHFGQDDHVRIYSADGLKTRLEKNDFHVKKRSFERKDDDFYFGFKSPETVLIANR